MSQGLIALLFGVGVFGAILFIVRQFSSERVSDEHKQRVLGRIYEEQMVYSQEQAQANVNILKGGGASDSGGKLLLSLPFGDRIWDLVQKAGYSNRVTQVFIIALAAFLISFVLISKTGNIAMALGVSVAMSVLIPRFILKRKIAKRNEAFINQFPDAVDMIVRSVKSGHPLNTALKMIAENMEPPVRTEFRQLVDEIAYGRSTVEALVRMSQRVDEPDLQFFVVILSVQQETGGNLAEVLSNLSGIIRKRKQLRLRIKAMTSEGRATAMILGSLPLVVFGAIHATSPEYLTVLFTTDSGHTVLMSAFGLVALAAFIVRNMLQIDI